MSTERYILGIESSCDETACALVTREGRIRGEAVASQVDLHARFGGVVPEVAARMHIQSCLPLVLEAMNGAGAQWDDIDAVAVTRGPGLVGCLLVGIETAKALAWMHGKPLIGVNHLAGHLYAIFLTPRRGAHVLAMEGRGGAALPLDAEPGHAGLPSPDDAANPLTIAQPSYPHIGLIVSGGHTSLVNVEGPDRVTTIAETVDDAAGEAYDKVARVAGLGYPGGPVVDKLAAEGNAGASPFTAPMMRRDQPNFSFSGLKTAAGREIERLRAVHDGNIPEQTIKDWCAGFQRAAVESLLGKSLEAARRVRARDLVIAGGVACNRGLRQAAAAATGEREHRNLRIWFSHPALCTDNAAMIAGLAWRLAPLPREEALTLNAEAALGFAES